MFEFRQKWEAYRFDVIAIWRIYYSNKKYIGQGQLVQWKNVIFIKCLCQRTIVWSRLTPGFFPVEFQYSIDTQHRIFKNVDKSWNLEPETSKDCGGNFHCTKGNVAGSNWLARALRQMDASAHILYYATLQRNSTTQLYNKPTLQPIP